MESYWSWAGTSTAATAAPSMATMGVMSSIIGVVQSGLGAYYSTQSTKSNLEFQSRISEINARMAEKSAQSILAAGEKEQNRISMTAGKVKASQKTHQAARGIQIGVGSAAEEIASTDLIKELDMNTVYRNAVYQSNAMRMTGTNYANQSLLQGTMASTISPTMSAATSLLTSGAAVSDAWYKYKFRSQFADALGVR